MMSNTTRQSLHMSVEGAATDFDFNKEMAIEESEDVATAARFREDRAHALETRGRRA
jgi:hypothetical protein